MARTGTERARAWQEKNRERSRELNKKYYQQRKARGYFQTPEWKKRRDENKAKWRQQNPDKVRNQYLKDNFGITLDEYDRQLEKQHGVCALCGKPCNTGRALAVDHNHETGKFRGLLCFRCNVALERFEVDGWPDKALEYVRSG